VVAQGTRDTGFFISSDTGWLQSVVLAFPYQPTVGRCTVNGHFIKEQIYNK